MILQRREIVDAAVDAAERINEEGTGPRLVRASDYVTGKEHVKESTIPDMRRVPGRLWDKFGGGENPALRKELFERLGREVEQNGIRAFRVIQSCVRSCEFARAPDRYFCTSVVSRMRESGMMLDPDERVNF